MILTGMIAMTMAVQDIAPDCGGNMREITACFAQAANQSEQRMNRYHAAALAKLRQPGSKEDRSGFIAAIHLTYSQKLFEQHVEAECAATYELFGMGSIRGAELLACRLHLYNQRTHDLWERWLTYPDSTAADLPEPEPIIAE